MSDSHKRKSKPASVKCYMLYSWVQVGNPSIEY